MLKYIYAYAFIINLKELNYLINVLMTIID